MTMTKVSLFFLLFCMFFISTFIHLEAAPPGSLVKKLPGFNGTFPSKHYSGYVTIEGSVHPKNLFYYFVVSERKPSTDPVVLWLNGGPGCSSFDGFVYEHGPFNFEEAKKKGDLPILHLNQHSWSKDSSIIYLDSPSGVGFSYPPDPTGDLQTAVDTHAFLLKWFKKFPEFLSNPFYITGESYAGVYVPTLATEVDRGIKGGIKPKINFKGYMIGNGVCDAEFDSNALVPFAHGMGLISEGIYKETEHACKGNYYNYTDERCSEMLDKIYRALQGLNIYDILEPCYHKDAETQGGNASRLPTSFKQLGKSDKPLPVRMRMFGRAWPYRAPVEDGIVTLWPQLSLGVQVPCTNDEVATIWLNNDAVRKAIHAHPESGEWSLCAGDLVYNHDAGSMINYHKNLIAKGYRVLIFSGDHDMCVPFTGSQAWTEFLGDEVVEEWRPWHSKHQVAGYLQGYANNLTFLTIKGAGHTVPEYKPKEALDFYSRWLQGHNI